MRRQDSWVKSVKRVDHNVSGGNLCNRMEQVQYVFDAAKNLNLAGDKRDEIFLETYNHLAAIYGLVIEKEKQFYNSFHLYGTPGENLRELQRRIDKLNSASGLNNLTAGNTEDLLSQIGVGDNYSTEEIVRAINSDPTMLKALSQGLSNNTQGKQYITGEAIQTLNNELNGINTSLGNFRVYDINNAQQTIQGLQQRLRIILNPPPLRVELDEPDRHLSSVMKDRLAEILKLQKRSLHWGKYSQMDEQQRQAYKNKVIDEILNKLDSSIKPLARQIMINHIDEFGIGTDKSNMHGFLGEVQLNIIMSVLCGFDSSEVQPTGTVRQTAGELKGKEIHIDALIRGCGFQVKNYNLKGEYFESSGEDLGAGHFFKNRAEMSCADILIDFFAALHYNQPVTENKLKTLSFPMYDSLYADMENYANSNKFDELIKIHADRIIGLDRNIIIEDMESPQLYFNTFFYVQGKLCPSSEILNSLMEEFYSQQTKDSLISASFSGKKGDNQNVFQEDILSGRTGRGKNVYSISNLAKVSYKITLNVKKIIDKALSRI